MRRLLVLLPLSYCPIDGHQGRGMAGTRAVGNGSSSGGMTTGETTTSGSPGY